MPKAVTIKFGAGSPVHNITCKGKLQDGNKIVVTTTRGLEFAEVIATNIEVNKEQLSDYVTNFERVATEEDIKKHEEGQRKRKSALDRARDIVIKNKLDMKLVDAEYTLDLSKVIISFTCEDRVDFRDLVKELANALKVKIELKQIGSRDYAKLIGGIGVCGQECCCIRYLNDFDKVSIKMAKNQNLSLNPTKISGICNRLTCCLAYENDTYVEINSHMPKIHQKVSTPNGEGMVMYNNILREVVTVKFDGDDVKILEFPLSEVKFDGGRNKVAAQNDNRNNGGNNNTKTNQNAEEINKNNPKKVKND